MPLEHEELTGRIVGASFAVSNALGCGFLEKVYERAMVVELSAMGLRCASQVPVHIQHRSQNVGDYVMDLVVESTVLVEVKATIEHHDIYVAQTINYLKATGLPVALLFNFGQPKVRYRRFVLFEGGVKQM